MNMKKTRVFIICTIFSMLLFASCFVLSEASTAKPEIISIESIKNNSKVINTIKWRSVKGHLYDICINEKNKWRVITRVTAAGSRCAYTYSNQPAKVQCYTIREVGKKTYGKFDKKGIRTVVPITPKVKYKNMEAVISWKSCGKGVIYRVYRKYGNTGKWRCIAKTTKKYVSDKYRSTFKNKAEKAAIQKKYCVDPSENKAVYSVSATIRKDGKTRTASRLSDGVVNMKTPVVSKVKISGEDFQIKWGTVPNAYKYKIMYGKTSSHFETALTVSAGKGKIQTASGKTKPGYTYYAVQAVYMLNGKQLYSGYEKGFTVKNRKAGRAIFLGDSITYGSPYKSKECVNKFTFANRVEQLTGKTCYNAGIPRGTVSRKSHCIASVAEKLYKGQYKNYGRLSEYDTVVLAGGTNDYGCSVALGSKNSKSLNKFRGALNRMFESIYKANKKRVASGRSKMKVVSVNLLFRNKKGSAAKAKNGFKTRNRRGLTLKAYQSAINSAVKKYRKKGIKIVQISSTEIVNSKNCSYVSLDNIHMTKGVYVKIGNKIAKALY